MELSFADLREGISRARAGLLRLGVQPGDRVVAYMPNIPETLIAFAATASIGAVWASCAPELGARSVVDRLAQLDPAVLLAVDGYGFRDRAIDRRSEVATIRAALPSLRHVVHVPYGEHELPDAVPWAELLAEPAPLEFLPVAFDHPLSVLFSSGTTGIPKAIVHGHGGILLEYLKAHALSWDLKPGGRLQWFTTTSWMMWHALVAALLLRSSIVMLDGDPAWPDPGWQWRLAEETRPTFMGVSPAFLMACRKAGLEPGRDYDLSSIRVFGTAGSPLPAEGYRYVYEQLGPDVLLINGSGGTDVCSGIVGGSALLPVYEGEISGRLLGVATDAFDPQGEPLVGALGELVITRPMPSMPTELWGDADGSLYRSSYFDMFPGIWRQGDWIQFSERGSCIVTGRSDATLNRGGVRLGTSEFYSVVEELPEITRQPGRPPRGRRGRRGRAAAVRRARRRSGAGRRVARRASAVACAPSSRRGTCPTRSAPCPRSPARSPARSSRRPSSASCSASRSRPSPAGTRCSTRPRSTPSRCSPRRREAGVAETPHARRTPSRSTSTCTWRCRRRAATRSPTTCARPPCATSAASRRGRRRSSSRPTTASGG